MGRSQGSAAATTHFIWGGSQRSQRIRGSACPRPTVANHLCIISREDSEVFCRISKQFIRFISVSFESNVIVSSFQGWPKIPSANVRFSAARLRQPVIKKGKF